MRFAVIGSVVMGAAAPAVGFDINQILTGLGLVGGGAALWKIVGIVIDKLVPSRSDKRSDVEASFSVLSKTIEILATEKASDAETLARAQKRIKELESDGELTYSAKRALTDQIDSLQARIEQKDRHIAALTEELARYGAKVTFDGEGHLRISGKANTGPIQVV